MSKIYTFNYLGFAALFNLTGKNFSYHSKWDINLLSLHILTKRCCRISEGFYSDAIIYFLQKFIFQNKFVCSEHVKDKES